MRQRNVHHRQEPEGQDQARSASRATGFRRQASAPHFKRPQEESQLSSGRKLSRRTTKWIRSCYCSTSTTRAATATRTILRDSIYDIEYKTIGIDIDVSEGNQYYIRDISGSATRSTPLSSCKRCSRAEGRRLRQEVDAQASGIRQGGKPRGDVRIVALPEQRLSGLADRASRDSCRTRLDRSGKYASSRAALYRQRGWAYLGNMRVARRSESARAPMYVPGDLYNRAMSCRTIRTLMSMDTSTRRNSCPTSSREGNELVDDQNWPLVEKATRPVQYRRRAGSETFVGSDRRHAQQPLAAQLLQEGRLAPLPFGTEPAPLDFGTEQTVTYYKALALSFTDPWLADTGPIPLPSRRISPRQNNAPLRMAEGLDVLPSDGCGRRSRASV